MNEKLISEFIKLGIPQKLAVVTLQVYLELCEVKRYYEVEYFLNEELNRILLKGKKKKDGPISMFLPYPYSDDLNMSKMKEFLKICKTESLIFAFVHPDSTCVYYQITEGLIEPTEITVKHLRENKQEKLDTELKKNRELLEQAALFRIPITIKTSKGNDKKNKKDETK